MDLTGKSVLITGASRGIGEATARAFAKAGAKVALTARSRDRIQTIAEDIGPSAIAIPCDVAKNDDVTGAVAMTVDAFGGLDVLINNAGAVEPIAHIGTSDPDAWGHIIDINLKGVYHGFRAALPIMEAAGAGSILTISSGAAHGPVEAWSHYCASKAAVHMLNQCGHKEYGDKGIRCLTLSPGTVATDMQREIKASGINPVSQLDWSTHIPAEWPAQALLWMLTPESDDFLGQEVKLRDEDIRRRVGLI
ncbi:MAG: SDR family oxidoreductase [Pseudomonadota bacterium]